MGRRDFVREARECRLMARVGPDGQRQLLLKLANAFEEIASAADARRAVEETRCW